MKGLVLAAGKGVRLRPLTEKKPKALVELNGKPLVEHVLSAMQEAGIEKAAVVVGHLGEMVKEKLGGNFNGMPLEYIEQPEALGTANAIALAKDFAGENSVVCAYADVIVESSTYRTLVEKYVEKKKTMFSENVDKAVREFDAVVVGREVRDPWRFGVLELEGNKVKRIIEKPTVGEEPSKIVNTGIYWFSPKVFGLAANVEKSERGELEITDALNEIAAEGRLGFEKCEGKCLDIGTLEELKEAEKELRNGKAK